MTVERVDITDDVLRPFAERYPFNPYRHYRLFPKPTQTNVLIAELQSFNPAASLHMARVAGAQAAVVARRLPWDSSFFNLAMARIEYVLGTTTQGPRLLGTALSPSVAMGFSTYPRRPTRLMSGWQCCWRTSGSV